MQMHTHANKVIIIIHITFIQHMCTYAEYTIISMLIIKAHLYIYIYKANKLFILIHLTEINSRIDKKNE